MCIRDRLKDEETAQLTATQIALDGIAVIVSNDNACEDLTMDQIKSVYTGEMKTWADVIK